MRILFWYTVLYSVSHYYMHMLRSDLHRHPGKGIAKCTHTFFTLADLLFAFTFYFSSLLRYDNIRNVSIKVLLSELNTESSRYGIINLQ